MAYQHGVFTWADISASDPAGASEFYTTLFGWDAEDQHDADGNYLYTMFSKDGKAVAGLGPQPPEMQQQGMPAMWNSYIAVDNVNATVDKWSLAGGTVIMPPIDVFTSGRTAVVADPEGAIIALWQAQDHPGGGIFNVPGTMIWNELNTRNPATARDFYGNAIGWQFEELQGGDDYWLISVPGKILGAPLSDDKYNGGIMTVGDDFPPDFPAYWSVYFATADVDADVAMITKLGGSVVAGPMDSTAGRIAVVADPSGAIFNLIQPPAPS